MISYYNTLGSIVHEVLSQESDTAQTVVSQEFIVF